MILEHFDVCLLMMCTAARLSDLMIIHFPRNIWPHNENATTIGKNPIQAMEWLNWQIDSGHFPWNQLPAKNPPKPIAPLASVNSCKLIAILSPELIWNNWATIKILQKYQPHPQIALGIFGESNFIPCLLDIASVFQIFVRFCHNHIPVDLEDCFKIVQQSLFISAILSSLYSISKVTSSFLLKEGYFNSVSSLLLLVLMSPLLLAAVMRQAGPLLGDCLLI